MAAVIPAVWNTDRAELSAAVLSIIDAFMAAVPGIVRKTHHDLPAGLTGEGPFVYLGAIEEKTVHDQGTRITEFTGTVGYVDVLADSRETSKRIDVFADYMRDLFSANYGILTQGVLQQTGFKDDAEISQGPLRFAAPALEFTFTVQRGRH